MPRGKKRMSFHRTVSLALLIPINQGLFKNEQECIIRFKILGEAKSFYTCDCEFLNGLKICCRSTHSCTNILICGYFGL